MPSLKIIKERIKSIKSTRKITTAMKDIAASKLRRAQTAAEEARTYENALERIVVELGRSMSRGSDLSLGHLLMFGRPEIKTHLLIVVTSERGLCGGYNHQILKEARRQIKILEANKTKFKLICIGKKASNSLQKNYGSLILEHLSDPPGGKTLQYAPVHDLAERLSHMFLDGVFDICSIIYTQFESVMSQKVSLLQLIPVPLKSDVALVSTEKKSQQLKQADQFHSDPFDYEPSEESILDELMTRNLSTQLYGAILESEASKHGARMTAMDSATRNAKKMIDKLSLQYNTARQAYVTKELIEIISGAETL